MSSQSLRQVFDSARKLSADEQAELVDLLLTGAEPNAAWDEAWANETEARLDEIERGVVEGIDADTAIAEGRTRLAEARPGK